MSAVLLVGCAEQPVAVQNSNINYGPAVASAALVFDPPITLGEAPINLSRADRGEAALVGYEDNATSYYDVFSDNRQSTDFSDRFVKESITERVGVTHR